MLSARRSTISSLRAARRSLPVAAFSPPCLMTITALPRVVRGNEGRGLTCPIRISCRAASGLPMAAVSPRFGLPGFDIVILASAAEIVACRCEGGPAGNPCGNRMRRPNQVYASRAAAWAVARGECAATTLASLAASAHGLSIEVSDAPPHIARGDCGYYRAATTCGSPAAAGTAVSLEFLVSLGCQ